MSSNPFVLVDASRVDDNEREHEYDLTEATDDIARRLHNEYVMMMSRENATNARLIKVSDDNINSDNGNVVEDNNAIRQSSTVMIGH
mmetsp:Transcript_4716/g.7141  ORF Transcript_4716/g.7141 Transcript_4716/m.7141 type:complete len:87 (-) Transcript_4716:1123-1383(-)